MACGNSLVSVSKLKAEIRKFSGSSDIPNYATCWISKSWWAQRAAFSAQGCSRTKNRGPFCFICDKSLAVDLILLPPPSFPYTRLWPKPCFCGGTYDLLHGLEKRCVYHMHKACALFCTYSLSPTGGSTNAQELGQDAQSGLYDMSVIEQASCNGNSKRIDWLTGRLHRRINFPKFLWIAESMGLSTSSFCFYTCTIWGIHVKPLDFSAQLLTEVLKSHVLSPAKLLLPSGTYSRA